MTVRSRATRLAQTVLQGAPGPAREMVVLNAAAVLMTAERAATLPAALALARSLLDSGAVAAKLAQLVQVSTAA